MESLLRNTRREQYVPELFGWTHGPLPRLEMELEAAELFSDSYPRSFFGKDSHERESDLARRQIVRAFMTFLRMRPTPKTGTDLPDWQVPGSDSGFDVTWRDAFFATQLSKVTALHIYGVPLDAVKPSLRADIRQYAEQFTDDAIHRYSSKINVTEGA